jgi:hypothetical protein
MKQQFQKWLCAVFIVLTLCPLFYASSQTYNVPVTLSVTSGAVNRFLASQWSSMQTSWSGSYQGLSYTIQLQAPLIAFVENDIVLILKLNVSYPYNNYVIRLAPKLTVPSTSATVNNITAQYVDLHQQIITNAAQVDARIQYVMENILSNINWIIYQGQILTIPSIPNPGSLSKVAGTDRLAWSITPVLSTSITNGELNLTVTSYITATP